MGRRADRRDSWPKALAKLAFAIGVVAMFPLLIIPWHEEQQMLEWQAWEAQQKAEREAAVKPFRAAFASGDRPAILDFCSTAIAAEFPYGHRLQALAWADDRVDAHVYVSAAQYGLRRVTCSSEGIGWSRIDHPLATLIPVENPPDPEDGPESLWSRMERLVALAPAELRSIELLLRPDDGSVVQRRVVRTDGGWEVDVEPVDAPAFALLSTSPALLATQAEGGGDGAGGLPAPAQEYPQRRWSSATGEAFELLARELPDDARARIVGLRFDDDEIEVAVAAPVAGLDAPYGDIRFDPWGAPTTWLYPRDEPPGFGCAVGRPLEQLRQAFLARCAEMPGCKPRTHFSIADFSCSQNGGGRWTLHIQSAN